jgi:hypothetical protein
MTGVTISDAAKHATVEKAAAKPPAASDGIADLIVDRLAT